MNTLTSLFKGVVRKEREREGEKEREREERERERCTNHGKDGKLFQMFQNEARFIPVSTATYMNTYFNCNFIELKKKSQGKCSVQRLLSLVPHLQSRVQRLI